jgi:hypothetical protein
MKKSISKMLEGGDRRSIGRSDRVAAMVWKDTKLFFELLAGLWAEDRLGADAGGGCGGEGDAEEAGVAGDV